MRVNNSEDGYELVERTPNGAESFLELNDTPGSYL
jgi:hypothetical protein